MEHTLNTSHRIPNTTNLACLVKIFCGLPWTRESFALCFCFFMSCSGKTLQSSQFPSLFSRKGCLFEMLLCDKLTYTQKIKGYPRQVKYLRSQHISLGLCIILRYISCINTLGIQYISYHSF